MYLSNHLSWPSFLIVYKKIPYFLVEEYSRQTTKRVNISVAHICALGFVIRQKETFIDLELDLLFYMKTSITSMQSIQGKKENNPDISNHVSLTNDEDFVTKLASNTITP